MLGAAEHVDRPADSIAQVHRHQLQFVPAGVELGHGQDVVDQLQHMVAAVQDVRCVVAVSRLADRAKGLFGDDFAEADHRIERRAQLMAHRREEPGFGFAGLVGGILRGPQIIGEGAQAFVCCRQQPVLEEQEDDEGEAAHDQRGGDGREDPVQLQEAVLVRAGQIAAIFVRPGRQPRQLAFEGLQRGEYARDRARTIDRLHQRFEFAQQASESLDGFALLGFGVGELPDIAVAEDLEAIAQDVEAELDFVLVDGAIRDGIGGDALLETVELRRSTG